MCTSPFTIATVGAAWKVMVKVKKIANLLDEVQEMLLPTSQHYTPIVSEITSQAKTQGMSTEPHIAPVLAKFEVALQFYDELYPDGEEEVSLVTQCNRDRRKGSKAHDEIMKASSNLTEYEKTLRHYLKPATVSAPPPPYRSPSSRRHGVQSDVQVDRRTTAQPPP